MRLLIITQKVDDQDDLLGFFVGWIGEFAKHFDRVFVITLTKGNYRFPENVSIYSLGKERGNSKVARAFNFYKYLFQLVPRSNGIFAHMSPIFVIASWPAALVFRKKIILWYLHRSVTLRLKIAERLCDKIVTAAKGSLGIKSRKVMELGHGIKVETFQTTRNWSWPPDYAPRILSVGRISRIKNYETLLRAGKLLKEINIKFKIKIIGRPVMPTDGVYLEELIKTTKELGLQEQTEFIGFMPHRSIAQEYKTADIVVGMTPKGGIDKSLLEAMASGALILTSNEEMAEYLGEYANKLIFNFGDPTDLTKKLTELNHWPADKKKEASAFLLDSVKRSHNLENLIEKITKLYESR